MGGWAGGLVGGFDWWVCLGGLTIISDFHATLGSGETVKKLKSDTCATHCAAYHFEMNAVFFF